ncbi:MAG: caspase family protein [Acidobacteriota bacterium]|nr:caspase family protein [Acidobacteriota bacterium]
MSQHIYFNGVDLESGEWRRPPQSIASLIASMAVGEMEDALQTRDVAAGVDPLDLSSAGWGVIVHADDVPVLENLAPLLNKRKEQAGEAYHEPMLYQDGETALQFLNRRQAPAFEAEPDTVPYYLLIVGPPERIGFDFQCELDVAYAVGRICFDRPEDYTHYAQNVLRGEATMIPNEPDVAVFGVQNGDHLTEMASESLLIALNDKINTKRESGRITWSLTPYVAGEATRDCLSRLLGGVQTPSLLLSVSHGISIRKSAEKRIRMQGGLICSDWNKQEGPKKREDCFFAEDLPEDADLTGLIALLFACYSAGTPEFDQTQTPGSKPRRLHKVPLVSSLPKAMLAHQNGALAVIGHVDQCFQFSFLQEAGGGQVSHFTSLLMRLASGQPVGYAMEHFNRRFAAVSARLAGQLMAPGTEDKQAQLTRWLAWQDSRSYIVLGDPAVHLPLAAKRTREPDRVSGKHEGTAHKRAALIGCATYGLQGPENDLELMEDLLAPHGFLLNSLNGEQATRQRILRALEQLIEDSNPEDAVLIYYSGHGGLAHNPDYHPDQQERSGQPPYYQFLVPTDMPLSTTSDFRGILDRELSDILARLTEKTRNVTVILDCCHAARLMRDTSQRCRALPRAWDLGLGRAVERVSGLRRRHAGGNPHVVRLNASGVMQSACEYQGVQGDVVGMLTESLYMILKGLDPSTVSWLTVGRWIRERVLAMNATQRVDLAGPASRLLFQTEETERTGVLRFFYDRDQPSLRGGRLQGVTRGSVYALLPEDAEVDTPERQLGEARVTRVLGGVSRVEVRSDQPLHGVLQAFPVEEAVARQPVSIEGKAPETLLAGLAGSRRLRLAEENEAHTPLRVKMKAGHMRVLDSDGLEIGEACSDTNLTLEKLTLLARARLLRAMTSGTGEFALKTDQLALSWGRVAAGVKEPLPDRGAMLRLGDTIYIEVDNRGARPVFINVFDLQLKRTIELLTDEQHSGVEVSPGEKRTLGFDPYDQVYDWEMAWPDDLPTTEPLPETLVVFVTDQPQDLTALETRAPAGVCRGQRQSALEGLIDHIGQGVTRDVRARKRGDVRYSIRHLDFHLNPNSTAEDTPRFLRDDRLHDSFPAYLGRTRGMGSGRKLAVCLDALVVHKNRAWLGADIRIDVLVTTNGKYGQKGAVHQQATFRFPGVKDGDRLSFGKLLVFHGMAHDYVDIAIWVSKHRGNEPDLGDMLQTSLNNQGLQGAIGTLGGPEAAAVGAAAGAAATLINMAGKLLARLSGAAIGLYRTSYLAPENFGIGRHPREGSERIQDFSLAYRVLDMDTVDMK